MVQSTPAGASTLAVGVGLVALGYLIKRRRWTGLISEATAVVPADAETAPLVASMVGNVTLVAGAFVAALGVLELLGVAALLPGWAWAGLLVAAVALVAPRLSLALDPE